MARSILILLFLTGCSVTEKMYYGVYAMELISIERGDDYHVIFVLHIGKDANYYTINYFVEDEFLYSETHDVGKSGAVYSNGYLHEFLINERAIVKIEVVSYIGKDFYITDTGVFYIRVMI